MNVLPVLMVTPLSVAPPLYMDLPPPVVVSVPPVIVLVPAPARFTTEPAPVAWMVPPVLVTVARQVERAAVGGLEQCRYWSRCWPGRPAGRRTRLALIDPVVIQVEGEAGVVDAELARALDRVAGVVDERVASGAVNAVVARCSTAPGYRRRSG